MEKNQNDAIVTFILEGNNVQFDNQFTLLTFF